MYSSVKWGGEWYLLGCNMEIILLVRIKWYAGDKTLNTDWHALNSKHILTISVEPEKCTLLIIEQLIFLDNCPQLTTLDICFAPQWRWSQKTNQSSLIIVKNHLQWTSIINSQERTFFMRPKIKRAKAIKNCDPLKHSFPSPGLQFLPH